MEIRYMEPEERSKVEALKGKHHVVNEFISMWTLWKNWEQHPPVIAVDAGEVVGLHAHTFTKSGYCNSYYQWLDGNYRGQRIGGSMVDVMIQAAYNKNIRRLKMRTPVDSDGYKFWTGFGLKPIAIQEEEEYYLFDQDIEDIEDINHFIEAAADWMYDPGIARIVTHDKRTRNLYLKQNVKWLNSHWEKELGNG